MKANNSELKNSVNTARSDVINNVSELKDMFNDLTRLLCDNIDKRKYSNIDAMLYHISEIFNKLDSIPEF